MSFFTFTSKNEVGLDDLHILEIDFQNNSGNGLGKTSGNALEKALEKILGKACPKASPSWMLID